MTPIESTHDTRLLTLLGVLFQAIESLALEVDIEPEQLFAEYLYLSNKTVHELGAETYIGKLTRHYGLLLETLN